VRVVFDTKVLARAHPRSQGPARRALLIALSGPHVLILSSYLLWELQRILAHPRVARSFRLSTTETAEYIERLAAVSALVTPAALTGVALRDASDAPVLGTALAGRADVLCTRAADFLENKVRDFCAAHGMSVMTELEFLTRVATEAL
jgi:uncharacterized protein